MNKYVHSAGPTGRALLPASSLPWSHAFRYQERETALSLQLEQEIKARQQLLLTDEWGNRASDLRFRSLDTLRVMAVPTIRHQLQFEVWCPCVLFMTCHGRGPAPRSQRPKRTILFR